MVRSKREDKMGFGTMIKEKEKERKQCKKLNFYIIRTMYNTV